MHKNVSVIASIVLIAALVLLTLGFGIKAKAASYFTNGAQTSSATTSPTFMTPGTATSSLIYDSNNSSLPNIAPDHVTLLTQVLASTTASKFTINIEYSDGVTGVDCAATPNACDWYQDDTLYLSSATTTTSYNILQPNTYSWTYASTTQGGVALVGNTNNRALKAINIPIRARYTRVFYTLTGANGAVWGKFVPIKVR